MTGQQVVDLPADRMEGDIVVAFFFQDQRPLHGAAGLLDWRLNGCLTDLLIQGEASGTLGEKIVAANNGKLNAEWALFAGAGLLRQWEPELVRVQLGQVLKTCRQAGFRRLSLCFPEHANLSRTELQNILNKILQDFGADAPDCLVSCAETKPALAV